MERIYKVHSIEREASKKDTCGPGRERLPDHIMYGQKYDQNRSTEKPKLDNVRKLRGIYFIDPDDKEYSEILKNARRKLERPMAPAMPCKRDKQHSSIVKANAKPKIGNEKEFNTMYGCMVESHQSTRQRAESLHSRAHKDRFAGKGFTSMTSYNLVHKFIPMPQASKTPDAKAAVDKKWKKLETVPAWDLGKVKSKKEVILEAQKDKMRVHYASLMDFYHLKRMQSWNPNCTSIKAESCSGETL